MAFFSPSFSYLSSLTAFCNPQEHPGRDSDMLLELRESCSCIFCKNYSSLKPKSCSLRVYSSFMAASWTFRRGSAWKLEAAFSKRPEGSGFGGS